MIKLEDSLELEQISLIGVLLVEKLTIVGIKMNS
jgi:hypothetical protein